ncbi:DUF721 domain-containing protein [Synechococcales cyanobacterium C]|uniref:DUF721 domain-containing protein n=1 Tax=Petrachloros mirabilis ULC683 TaxID=2781853 RepID=A0A8K1ZVV7_9CYAN|nr:DUF721 domain-containing protein [Petrachloros mirabilis]NCJ05067.1 DUF721 domain-containing protein [Petrachloros mirabilis ULC683]
MSLAALNQVLAELKQAHWRNQQKLEELLKLWSEIVGPAVASQTRPVKITADQVLYVATSSSVWAQNLIFERALILQKLNTVLTPPLVDLHFSTREWQSRPSQGSTSHLPLPLQPGFKSIPRPPLTSELDPQTAFERWAQAIQLRGRSFPLCPQCQCPTPPTELSRWSTCALCAVRTHRASGSLPNREQQEAFWKAHGFDHG